MSHYQEQFDTPGLRRFYIRESVCSLRDIPERLRPAQEIDRLGFANVSDSALLAILLTGTRTHNPVDLATGLLHHFRTLTGIKQSSTDELSTVDGMTDTQARRLLAALELGTRQQEEQREPAPRIRAPEDVARLVSPMLRDSEQELMLVLCLDSKNGLKGQPVQVSKGLVDASLIHPREVFREAIRRASAAIVICHNHPTGDTTPSAEDIRITRQLLAAGKVVDIKLQDHIIIGHATTNTPSFCSFRESGIVDFS